MKMNALGWIASILVIIGAINWGLVGAINLDLVDFLVGTVPWLAKTVYILVGLSGIYFLWMVFAKK